ncbi:MAG: hypothetical protein N2255_08180 [Kiritimatiellae bacterium]|nr:hypothetical protein [Kiritimatiellia bacterium]
MSPTEDPISPEEKLLNLIKGKGEKTEGLSGAGSAPSDAANGANIGEVDAPTVAPEADMETVPSVGTADTSATERPRLRLVRREPAPAGEEGPKPSRGAAGEGELIGEASVPVIGSRRRQPVFDLGIANRILVAVIVVILCFGLYEIWGHVNSFRIEKPPPLKGSFPTLQTDEGAGPVTDVAKVQELAAFIVDPADWVPGTTNKVTGPPPPPPLKLSLKGISRNKVGATEAVLVEQDTGRLYCLVAGQKARIGETEVEVLEIRGDRVVVRRGSEQFTVHAKSEQPAERRQDVVPRERGR